MNVSICMGLDTVVPSPVMFDVQPEPQSQVVHDRWDPKQHDLSEPCFHPGGADDCGGHCRSVVGHGLALIP